MKKTVLFYSSVKTKKMFSIQSYYRNDILILKSLGYNVLLSKTFWDFVCFWKYDIAFLYFYRYSFIPAFLSKIYGKKVYFTGGIDYLDKNFATKRQRTIQKYFFRLCNIFSDGSILVSSSDKENIKELYGGKLPKKYHLSFHSVDFEKFEYQGNFSDKKMQFCTIAWMVNLDNVFRKGIDKSVRIFAELLAQYPQAQFYIAGPEGEGSKYLVKMIQSLNLQNSVFYLGTITENEKIQLLKQSRFYFQLSEYEGFGIAAIEALAAGCCVVHSGRGGLKDAVADYGYKVNITDECEIGNIVASLCNQPIDSKLIIDGIRYVKINFSFEQRKTAFQNIIGNQTE